MTEKNHLDETKSFVTKRAVTAGCEDRLPESKNGDSHPPSAVDITGCANDGVLDTESVQQPEIFVNPAIIESRDERKVRENDEENALFD